METETFNRLEATERSRRLKYDTGTNATTTPSKGSMSNSIRSSYHGRNNVRVITKRTEIFVGSPDEKSLPTVVIRKKGSTNEAIIVTGKAKSPVLEMLSPPEEKIIHWSSGKPKFLPELNIMQQPIQPLKNLEKDASSKHDILSLPTIKTKEQRQEQQEEEEQHQMEQSSLPMGKTARKQETNSHHRVMNAMMSLMGGRKIRPSLVLETGPISPLCSSKVNENDALTNNKHNDPHTAMISFVPQNDPRMAVILASKSYIPPTPSTSWYDQAKRRAQSITHSFKIGPTPPPIFTPVS